MILIWLTCLYPRCTEQSGPRAGEGTSPSGEEGGGKWRSRQSIEKRKAEHKTGLNPFSISYLSQAGLATQH